MIAEDPEYEEAIKVAIQEAKLSAEAAVTDAVNARVEKQKTGFRGYGVDQTEMLEHSITESAGGYVLFYSGNDPQKVKSAFHGAL